MKILAIDPSSTELGWAVLNDDDLLAWGTISTRGVAYEDRYTHILNQLSHIGETHTFKEIACERAIRYSPSEWKVSTAGYGNADKQDVARAVCLLYPQLPGDITNHVTDAIGIGIHHQAIRKLESMSA